MRKTLLVMVSVVMMSGPAIAADITACGVNIKDVVSNTRAGVWVPISGGKTFKTVYTPIISLHSAGGVEYAVFDVGAAAPGDMTQGYAFLAAGFRVDNLLTRLANSSGWIKSHVGAAQLPTMEAGIGPMLYGDKVRWGASIALKF